MPETPRTYCERHTPDTRSPHFIFSLLTLTALLRLLRPLLLVLLLPCSLQVRAQTLFTYYDVDRLYDTIPSPFYDDTAYTPTGRYGWNTERYARKVRDIAAVLDSLRVPIVALHGVENEQVVRDLSAACSTDYVYLHRTLNTLDGLDFALLYHGDRFRPFRCRTGRRMLRIDGILQQTLRTGGMRRDTVTILLAADPATAALHLRDCLEEAPRRPLLAAGRLEGIDAASFGLTDRMARAARRGHGTRRTRNGWRMRDRIFTSPALGDRPGQVYIRRFLLDADGTAPLPTCDTRSYRGGRSGNLPLWCEIGPDFFAKFEKIR